SIVSALVCLSDVSASARRTGSAIAPLKLRAVQASSGLRILTTLNERCGRPVRRGPPSRIRLGLTAIEEDRRQSRRRLAGHSSAPRSAGIDDIHPPDALLAPGTGRETHRAPLHRRA